MFGPILMPAKADKGPSNRGGLAAHQGTLATRIRDKRLEWADDTVRYGFKGIGPSSISRRGIAESLIFVWAKRDGYSKSNLREAKSDATQGIPPNN